MKAINSYPSVYAIGHKAIVDIFDGDVTVEEKVDGSQFSMAKIDGQLHCRSKGKELVVDAPEKMFEQAVAAAKALLPILNEGCVYRCEYLQKPKHNVLAYSRVPRSNLIVFDIMYGIETYINRVSKEAEAARIGLECVPSMFCGKVGSLEELRAFLDRESTLGGCKIEGVVVKNYSKFTRDKKVYIGKYVSEAFKEVHRGQFRKANPTAGDITTELIASYRNEARWRKAMQHLRESSQLQDSPADIGPLIKEIQADIKREEETTIRDVLFEHFWPKIQRGAIAGFPEFYKDQLARSAFNQP